MPKQTQIEKAIAALLDEIAVLTLAVNKLREQQKVAPKKPRAVKPRLADVVQIDAGPARHQPASSRR